MAKLTLNTLNTRVDAIESKLDKMIELLTNAQTPAPAPAKANATATHTGKGKATANEVDKKAKAEATAQARLAYKQDKRTRNCLTKAENKLVAKQMREQGLNPSDKGAWEKAKKAYIKANPLV
ncbi:MAG: hypothetical protein IKV38_02435 [Clostridia bacterium]|nr:hypothetical protein [Clostridia bacterium]